MTAMRTPLRVTAFVTALVATFAVAWGAGRVVGPLDRPEPPQHQQMGDRMDQEGGSSHDD